MANDKWLEEIADKLQNHASEVNPNMWNAISSQVGAGASGAGAGASVFSAGKVAAIVIGVASVTIASYFALQTESLEPIQNNVAQKTEKSIQDKEIKTSIEESTKESIAEPTLTQDKTITTPESSTVKPEDVNEPIASNNTIEIKINVPEPIRKIESKPADFVKTASSFIKSENKVAEIVPKEKEIVPVVKEATSKTTSYPIKKLPNVFSPNGDGANDYFEVISEGLYNYSLVVLDRDNKTMWTTDSPNAKWDGLNMGGEKAPSGEYIYFIAADGPNGEKIAKYERLTIQR